MENVCDSDLAENFDDYRKVLSLLNDILKQDVAPKIDSAFVIFARSVSIKPIIISVYISEAFY
mgnify:CR=1 FL=1